MRPEVVLPGGEVAVDKWVRGALPPVRLHFLSHCHADHMHGLTPSWAKPIYCSPVTANLLPVLITGLNRSLLRPLAVGESHVLSVPGAADGRTVTVTLLEAHHCPGAVMFAFEGDCGTILCTGDFRLDAALRQRFLDEPVYERLRQLRFGLLYLDNTYLDVAEQWPSREAVTEDIIRLLKAQPKEKEVLIAVRKLGKEQLLEAIALALGEWISVWPDRLAVLCALEAKDVFTVDSATSRVHAVRLEQLSTEYTRHRKENGGRSPLVVIPSCLNRIVHHFKTAFEIVPKEDLHWFPYSDHSSRAELLEFLSLFRYRKMMPISQPLSVDNVGLKLGNLADDDVSPVKLVDESKAKRRRVVEPPAVMTVAPLRQKPVRLTPQKRPQRAAVQFHSPQAPSTSDKREVKQEAATDESELPVTGHLPDDSPLLKVSEFELAVLQQLYSQISREDV